MATISTNNQPNQERTKLEVLLGIQALCVKAHEHYFTQASTGDTVDTYLLGAAEGYASVARHLNEAIENIATESGLDVRVVRDEMEKQNQDMSDV